MQGPGFEPQPSQKKHYVFTFSVSIVLIFVLTPTVLCKFTLVLKIVTKTNV